MKILLYLPLLFLLLPLGCSHVSVETPLGPPEKIFDADRVDGTWIASFDGDREAYSVRRLADGSLRFAFIDWDAEKKKFLLETFPGALITIDDEPYLQLKMEDDYLVFRLSEGDAGRMTLHHSSLPLIAKAVDDGDLKGKVYRNGQNQAELESVSLKDGRALRRFIQGKGKAAFPRDQDLDIRLERLNR